MNKPLLASVLIALVFSSLQLCSALNSPLDNFGTPKSDWNMVYTGIGDWAWINSAIQTADGGYALVGTNGTKDVILNHIYYPGQSDPMLIKTNSSGGLEWVKTYLAETGNAGFQSVVQTNDLGFAAYSTDGFLWKTDKDGNLQWTKQVVSSINHGGEAIQTSDEGYLFTNAASVFKTDSNGDGIWNFTLPDTANDVIRNVVEDNGTFVLVGAVGISGSSGNYDGWFGKLNSNGALIENQTYRQLFQNSSQPYSVVFNTLSKTSDGGYILAGATGGGDAMWLYKTDTLGNVDWDRLYESYSTFGVFVSVIQLNQGYAGFTFYNLSLIDISGNQIWSGTYDSMTGVSDSGYRFPLLLAECGVATQDGGFAIAGMKNINDNYRYLWFAKFSFESSSPSPTPSPSAPEFPTWITLSVVAIAAVVVAAFSKCRKGQR